MSDTHPESTAYLWEKFEQVDFKAFVYDFYYSIPNVEEATIGDVYDFIFGSSEMYSEFLLFCNLQSYSFAEQNEAEVSELELYLLAFEAARAIVKGRTLESLHTILSVTELELKEATSTQMIPNKDISYAEALKKSITLDIPVNSQGEVIYTLKEIEGGFEVYSHERGVHSVNTEGMVVWSEQHSTDMRVQTLNDIKLLSDSLSVLKETESQALYTEEILLYLKGMRKKYSQEKNEPWTGTPAQSIKFRMYLWEQLTMTEATFKKLKQVDHRYPKLRIVKNNDI